MTTEERIEWLDKRIAEARAWERNYVGTPHAVYYVGLRHAYQNVRRDLDIDPQLQRLLDKLRESRSGSTNPKRGSSHAASAAAEGETP